MIPPLAPMKKHNKVQIAVQLEPEQAAAIDRLAILHGVSRSAVVRHALASFLLAANINSVDTRHSEPEAA